jgi:GT2 family glycosyltransferase
MEYELSIIIVNWNTKKLLKNCIDSIIEKTIGVSYEIIVVDNNSTDGSSLMVNSYHRDNENIRLIQNKKNELYSVANNVGFSNSQGEYICLLNTDIILITNTFRTCIDYLKENKQVGIVGPKFLNENGSLQRLYRRLPSIGDMFFLYNIIGRIIDKLLYNGVKQKRYMYLDCNFDEETNVEQIGTSCAILHRDIIHNVGGLFDEYYDLYFNDVDLCKRVLAAGYLISILPSASLIHLGSKSTSKLNKRKNNNYLFEDMWHYFVKHFHWKAIILIIIFPIRYGILSFYLLRQLFKKSGEFDG